MVCSRATSSAGARLDDRKSSAPARSARVRSAERSTYGVIRTTGTVLFDWRRSRMSCSVDSMTSRRTLSSNAPTPSRTSSENALDHAGAHVDLEVMAERVDKVVRQRIGHVHQREAMLDWAAETVEGDGIGVGDDHHAGAGEHPERDRQRGRGLEANLPHLELVIALAVRREVEHAGRALHQRLETAVIQTGHVAGERQQRRDLHFVEELDQAIDRRGARGTAVEERHDRVDRDAAGLERREVALELDENGVSGRRTSQATDEIELEAKEDESLLAQRPLDVDAEVRSAGQHVGGIVVRDEDDGFAALEPLLRELQAGDALSGSRVTADDVRPIREGCRLTGSRAA